MNNIKEEFFTSFIGEEKETVGNKMVYEILPKYGNGVFNLYKIINGMYLCYNNLHFNNIIKNTKKYYATPIIKIDYCIEGSYISNCTHNRVCITNKGNTAYYAGTDSFIDVDFKGTKYKSISIFCYIEEFINSINRILDIPKSKLEEYYNKLNNNNKFLIIKTDIEINDIINKILEYIECDDIIMIKLKVIELFVLELNKHETYKNNKKQYFKKSTIEKVDSIKIFIQDNMNNHITIDNLARKYDINITELKKCFKQINGVGTYTYLKNCRMNKACELLLTTEHNILEVANIVGYTNQSKFSAAFKKTFGITPLKYKSYVK